MTDLSLLRQPTVIKLMKAKIRISGLMSGMMFRLSGMISGTTCGVLTVHWSNRDAFLDKSAINVQNNRH